VRRCARTGSAIGLKSHARVEIPAPLSHYQAGRLNLGGLITTTYRLEDINQGYQDMKHGKNIRGMVVYADADR
jgi:S-(hydroxymethyl)glutathione dehydrogenase/alcohol dehydrogenase